MRPVVWVLFGFVGLAIPSMFSDIVKGMIGSKDKKISNVIKQLPQDYVKQIQTSENEAGQFVCQILINHNIPGAIEDLGEDVWKEIKDDWSAVTDFVESLPTLAPQILQGIVQDAEDVVSVVEEIITNPAAALTVIEGGVKTVISDIESVGGDVITFIECLFGCKSSHVTSANPAATLSNSCHSVLANAPASTTHYSTSTSTYHPTTTAIVYVTGTRPSSTTQSALISTSSKTPTATAQSNSIHISTSSRTSTVIVQPSSSLSSTSTRNAAQSASGNNQVATTSSSQNVGTSGAIRGIEIRVHGVQIWAGLLVYFLVFVAVL